jgi:uncharacterized delta-60 repeat protein
VSWLLVLVSATGAQAAPGDLDPSFGGDGWVVKDVNAPNNVDAVLIQPDGRIVVAGRLGRQFAIWRLLSNGDLDLSFGGGGEATVPFTGRGGSGALAAGLQPDGRIVLVGYGGTQMAIARLLPDGSPDPQFGEGDGKTKIPLSGRVHARADDVELLPDGRILLGGTTLRSRYGREVGTALSILTSQGTLDPSFGTGGTLRTRLLFGDTTFDGQKVVLVGKDRKGTGRFFVARYGLDGAPDATFGGDGVRRRSLGHKVDLYEVTEVVADGAGRMVLTISGAHRKCFLSFGAVVRLNADGSWDGTFSGDGVVPRLCANAGALVIQGDDRIVVAGEVFAGAGSGEYYPLVTRMEADGAPDETFGDGGSVRSTPDFYFWSAGSDVALQQDGKIVLLADAIYEQSFGLARFLAA